MESRQQSFDIMKGVACIAVVLIHYNFKGEPGAIVKACCRFAVPLFFMISGYFYRREKTLDSTGKLVRIHLISTLFYGVFFYCWEMLWARGKWMDWTGFATKYLSSPVLVKFFVTNDGLFNVMLWFIGALILCHLTVACLARDDVRLRRVCYLIIPALVMMCICQEFAQVVGFKYAYLPQLGLGGSKAVLGVPAIYLFRALPFFLFGVWIRLNRNVLANRRWPGFVLPILALAGCILAPVEYRLLGSRVAQFYLGSYLTAASLFVWAIACPTLKCPPLAYLGCKLSLLVYVLQLCVGKSVDLLARNHHWYGCVYDWSRAPLVLAMTILMAFCVHVTLSSLSGKRAQGSGN